MRRLLIVIACFLGALWLGGTWYAGNHILPPMLLNAPMPERNEADRATWRASLLSPGATWTQARVAGGEGRPLDVWWLRRPRSRGVVVFLHGFGDDAWGTLGRAKDLPEWDAVGFTFRGRDLDSGVPCTLGAWERVDAAAVIRHLEAQGVPRSRIILAAWSMGAGTALLALSDLEGQDGPLAGALLECPFESMTAAARDHVRLALGTWEILVRPAVSLALRRAGRMARFDPKGVNAAQAAAGLRTPIALLTGDADPETPLPGVQAIARFHPDLTVVPGAGHCQAGGRLPGGWRRWAETRLEQWKIPAVPLS